MIALFYITIFLTPISLVIAYHRMSRQDPGPREFVATRIR